MDTVKIAKAYIPNGTMVIYVPSDGDIRFIKATNAFEMILPDTDEVDIRYMGKTPYVLCAFKKYMLRIEGSTYFLPEFLIMKKENDKLESLCFREAVMAFREFYSRLADVKVGGVSVTAYCAD